MIWELNTVKTVDGKLCLGESYLMKINSHCFWQKCYTLKIGYLDKRLFNQKISSKFEPRQLLKLNFVCNEKSMILVMQNLKEFKNHSFGRSDQASDQLF